MLRDRFTAARTWIRTPQSYELFVDALHIFSGERAARDLCATIDRTIASTRSRGYAKLAFAGAAVSLRAPLAAYPLARNGLVDIGWLSPRRPDASVSPEN